MDKSKKIKSIIIFAILFIIFLAGSILIPGIEKTETIQEVMKDAVLHETNKVNLFGIMNVNPGAVSALLVSAVLIVFAIVVRIFVIPKFKRIPGKFQMLLEAAVGLFDNMAKDSSPVMNKVLGGYIFFAGAYIFFGTIFELFGIQVASTAGNSISLPAPLADINGAISMGVLSFIFILIGGACGGGARGFGNALKDFSLPISMSFRLFGALLSGALVTELVYYSFSLSIGVPIFVGVMFTLLHAIIQAYVLTTLVSIFYGESAEKRKKKKQAEE